MKYLRGMRGIKPTPLKLYFIATPATDGPSLATPSESCLHRAPLPFPLCSLHPARIPFPFSLSLSLSPCVSFSLSLLRTAAQSYMHNVAIRRRAKPPSHPEFTLSFSPCLPLSFLPPSPSLLSATDPPDVAFRHITKRQKPVCRSNRWEARGISHPKRFYLSVASPTRPPRSVARARAHHTALLFLPFCLFFFRFFPVPTERDLPSR